MDAFVRMEIDAKLRSEAALWEAKEFEVAANLRAAAALRPPAPAPVPLAELVRRCHDSALSADGVIPPRLRLIPGGKGG